MGVHTDRRRRKRRRRRGRRRRQADRRDRTVVHTYLLDERRTVDVVGDKDTYALHAVALNYLIVTIHQGLEGTDHTLLGELLGYSEAHGRERREGGGRDAHPVSILGRGVEE